MAQVTVNIPDLVVDRVLDAFDASYPGRPEGVPKAAWAREQVIRYVRGVTVAHERSIAASEAAAAASTAAETEVLID